MSQQRYKSIKSGNRLEKKLLSQRPEYADISEQILNNYFYNNNEIEKESKKLLKKMNKNQNLFINVMKLREKANGKDNFEYMKNLKFDEDIKLELKDQYGKYLYC